MQCELVSDGFVLVRIQDDGFGFSDSALLGFGVRKTRRTLMGNIDGRLSVGLGSVIMKTVAEIHGGRVVAENRLDPFGNIRGAEIRIYLPRRP